MSIRPLVIVRAKVIPLGLNQAGVMVSTFLGELLERPLFFTTVAPDRMPGGFDA